MLFDILLILWHSAFVVLPFIVSRFGAKDVIKKATKLDIRYKIRIYGQSLITPIVLTAFMFGHSGEGDTESTLNVTEIESAFIVACVSAFAGCFYEIYRHNSK